MPCCLPFSPVIIACLVGLSVSQHRASVFLLLAIQYAEDASIPTLLQVDIIFDDSYGFGTGNQKDLAGWKQLYDISDAVAETIPALSQGNVYAFNNRLSSVNAAGDVGSDWFESAVVRPDLVRAPHVYC